MSNIKFKDMYNLVHDILLTKPKLRDSDSRLVFAIHKSELTKLGLDLKVMTAYDYAILVINKQLSDRETIGRARRKVQEQHPETRGTKYKERQARQTDYIDEIKNTDNPNND